MSSDTDTVSLAVMVDVLRNGVQWTSILNLLDGFDGETAETLVVAAFGRDSDEYREISAFFNMD